MYYMSYTFLEFVLAEYGQYICVGYVKEASQAKQSCINPLEMHSKQSHTSKSAWNLV